jgi:hypothetical protein
MRRLLKPLLKLLVGARPAYPPEFVIDMAGRMLQVPVEVRRERGRFSVALKLRDGRVTTLRLRSDFTEEVSRTMFGCTGGQAAQCAKRFGEVLELFEVAGCFGWRDEPVLVKPVKPNYIANARPRPKFEDDKRPRRKASS